MGRELKIPSLEELCALVEGVETVPIHEDAHWALCGSGFLLLTF